MQAERKLGRPPTAVESGSGRVKRRAGSYSNQGGRSSGDRSGLERNDRLLTFGETWYCERARGTNGCQGATLSRGLLASHKAAVGTFTLLRHLALILARFAQGQQADRGPGEGLQLQEQEEGGDKSFHPVSTLMMRPLQWQG